MLATASSAQTLNISCPTQSYKINLSGNTIAAGGTAAKMTWKFDGEWLRIARESDGRNLAFMEEDGVLLEDGAPRVQGCRFDNPEILADLPLSEGATLRAVFVAMSLDARKNIQANLSRAGFYDSTIDGLWGNGTETAVLAAAIDFSNEGLPGDLTTRSDAARLIANILGGDTEEGECDGCDAIANTGGRASEEPIERSAETASGTSQTRPRTRPKNVPSASPPSPKPTMSIKEAGVIAKGAAEKCSGAATIKGICFGQSLSEMEAILTLRDYTCDSKHVCNMTESQTATITIENDSIRFACGAFDACDMQISDLAQALIDQGLVSEMVADRTSGMHPMFDNVYYTRSTYCGNDAVEQMLCVEKFEMPSVNLLFPTTLDVVLSRGRFGRRPVQFN